MENYPIIISQNQKQNLWLGSKQRKSLRSCSRKAIGGDIWTNRQKSLPTKSGRKYFEADLNYNCGNRNADRVVFLMMVWFS